MKADEAARAAGEHVQVESDLIEDACAQGGQREMAGDEHVQVESDLIEDARTLHLDSHDAPIPQHALVDLTDGGGGERLLRQ